VWYAIIAAVFLAVGIGLMFWALLERSKRHAAELGANAARRAEQEAASLADANAGAAGMLRDQLERLEAQVSAQRDRLAELRKLLGDKAPMPVIKEWLDQEGEGGEI
jgi:uncharacterized protein HemX